MSNLDAAKAAMARLEAMENSKRARAIALLNEGLAATRECFVKFLHSLPQPQAPLPIGMVCKVPVPGEPGMFYEVRKTR